jgi:chemotaxis protein CheX
MRAPRRNSTKGECIVDSAHWNEVDEKVVESAYELFEACGVEAALEGAGDAAGALSHETILSVIGFGGDHLRGSLVVAASNGVIRATHPAAGQDGAALSDDELRDWAGELANQLLGRIKTKLLARGIVIQMSTPTTISAIQIRLGAARGENDSEPRTFEVAGERAQVRFEALAEPGVSLCDEQPRSDDSAAEEGSMLIF